jgi:hypothetical protein
LRHTAGGCKQGRVARLYPRTLLDADVKTGSERKVFELLREGFPTSGRCSTAGWIDRDPFEGARDGKIDFVLCRADRPLVCLEVKGGGIDCKYWEWYRTEPGAKPERIPDPFGQALDHRYDLGRLLEVLADRLAFAAAIRLASRTR